MTSTLTPPKRTRPGRATAYLTLAAGSLFVGVPLLVEFVAGEAFVLMGVGGLLVLLALPGLRRLQGGADGWPGALGLRLVVGGLVVLILLIVSGDPLDAALSGTAQEVAEGVFTLLGAVSVLALFAGVLSFSVGMTRAGVFPASAIWIFLSGMTLALLAELFEQSLAGEVPVAADVLPVLGFMVAGAGLLLLGRSALRMTTRSPAPQHPMGPATATERPRPAES